VFFENFLATALKHSKTAMVSKWGGKSKISYSHSAKRVPRLHRSMQKS